MAEPIAPPTGSRAKRTPSGVTRATCSRIGPSDSTRTASPPSSLQLVDLFTTLHDIHGTETILLAEANDHLPQLAAGRADEAAMAGRNAQHVARHDDGRRRVDEEGRSLLVAQVVRHGHDLAGLGDRVFGPAANAVIDDRDPACPCESAQKAASNSPPRCPPPRSPASRGGSGFRPYCPDTYMRSDGLIGLASMPPALRRGAVRRGHIVLDA